MRTGFKKTTVITLFSICAMSMAIAGVATAWSANPPTQLTNDTFDQYYPELSGNIVVWQDYRHIQDSVYAYSLLTGTEVRVSPDDGLVHYGPVVGGNMVAYYDSRNGNNDVFVTPVADDGTLGTEIQITANASTQMSPAVSGTYVVWRDMRNGNSDVFWRAITGALGSETAITTAAGDQFNIQISGDYVIWEDDEAGYRNIYYYRISDGLSGQIPNTLGNNRYNSNVSDGRVVWQEDRPSNTDIFMYDILTATETQITTDVEVQTGAAIDGDFVVWEDYRGGVTTPAIYAYKISTGETHEISGGITGYYPAISGLHVVWEGYPDIAGDGDIMMTEIMDDVIDTPTLPYTGR